MTKKLAEPVITLSIAGAARSLDVSRDLVYRLITTGELPVVRLGGRVLIRVAALEAWAERNESVPERVAWAQERVREAMR